MKHVEPARRAASARRAAASDHADEGRRAGLGRTPTPADGAAQQAQLAAIDQSPQAVAQRRQLDAVFGAGAAVQAAGREQRDDAAAPQEAGGLPAGLKAGVEALSGLSMDPVRVHYNSSQPAQLDAMAFAQGPHIHVAPGQEQHLPHEAWHVVQQAQGRVRPTTEAGAGVAVNDDAALEREADAMGARAQSTGVAQRRALSPLSPSLQSPQLAGRAVHQLWEKVAKQKGLFKGDPSYHHLHQVGGEEHYRYGNGKRINYLREGVQVDYDAVQRAIEACNAPGSRKSNGKDACLAYLRELLSRKPKETETKPSAPERKDSPPPTTKGTGTSYSDSSVAADLFSGISDSRLDSSKGSDSFDEDSFM